MGDFVAFALVLVTALGVVALTRWESTWRYRHLRQREVRKWTDHLFSMSIFGLAGLILLLGAAFNDWRLAGMDVVLASIAATYASYRLMTELWG